MCLFATGLRAFFFFYKAVLRTEGEELDFEIESLLARAGEAVERAKAMAGAERRMSSGHKGSWFVMT